MSVLTEEKWKNLGKIRLGLIVGKTLVCDWCGGLISFYHFKVGDKDGCTLECRDLLESKGRKPKRKEKEAEIMKKDIKKKHVEEDEEVLAMPDPDEDDDVEKEEPKPKKWMAKAKQTKAKEVKAKEPVRPVKIAKPVKVAPVKTVKAAPVVSKASKKAKAKIVKPRAKKPIKNPYTYRAGTTIRKLFERLTDGKWHVKHELFRGLKSPDEPLRRLRVHADRWDWNWESRGDQVKLVVPKKFVALGVGKVRPTVSAE